MAWFISDPSVIAILETITALAGPSFALPYDSSIQPPNGSDMVADDLLQFKLPGGSQVQSITDPSSVTSMGRAISGLMAVISPFISAYTMILPILGVIRGIIEVICALMNPWALVGAVIRLFRKWIPAFLSLFPPLAGVVIILSIIKMILAIVFFIMTTIVPMFQLIKHDIQALDALIAGGGNPQQIAAEETKLTALAAELLNQTGLLNVIKPILEIVMAILQLAGGKPCKHKKRSNCPPTNLTGVVASTPCDEDETCCDDNVCPPAFTNPPAGQALVLPAVYANAPSFFAWTISTLTGNSNLPQIAPYIQSAQQLSAQLSEPVNEAHIAGESGNSATFNIQITGRRGQQTITDPIIQISGNDIIVIDPALATAVGVVQYKIVPNWDILVAKNIVGLGCHPDIAAARDSLDNQFNDIETPALQQYPELGNIGFDTFVNNLNQQLNIGPPYSTAAIDAYQSNTIALCNGFVDNLKNIMNSVLSKTANPINTGFAVDKNIVKAGGTDKAVISVIPKDSAGVSIAKQLPQGVGVNVQLFSTFGIISNQTTDNSTGMITADLTSLFSGAAILTAQINGQYITEFSGNAAITQELSVQFISDAVLPKRRSVVDLSVEKEPGGK